MASSGYTSRPAPSDFKGVSEGEGKNDTKNCLKGLDGHDARELLYIVQENDNQTDRIPFYGSERKVFRRGEDAIVSFPGVYGYGWKKLTTISSAQDAPLATSCIFLPDENAPGYGRHDDQRGQGCSCYFLYGKPEKWGCNWFSQWKEQTLRAFARRCQLVVVTKRDGTLGRSQKGEVRFLEEEDMPYELVTIDVFAKKILAASRPSPGQKIRMVESSRSHVLLSGIYPKEIGIEYVRAVKKLLDDRGVHTLMVERTAQSARGLSNAAAVVAFCTPSYGQRTGHDFFTYEELRYIYEKRGPVIPLRMHKDYPPCPGEEVALSLCKLVFSPGVVYINGVDEVDGKWTLKSEEIMAELIYERLRQLNLDVFAQ